MKNTPRFMTKLNIRAKLIVSFIIVGMVPVVFVAYLGYSNAADALTHAAEQKLHTLTIQKKIQLQNMVAGIRSNLKALSQTNEIREIYKDLIVYHKEMGTRDEEAFDMSSSTPGLSRKYDDIYNELRFLLNAIPSEYGYEDMLLICANHGHVMYSHDRSADLGINLSMEFSDPSPLHDIWFEIGREESFVLSDIKPCDRQDGAPSLFAGVPVHDSEGKPLGNFVVRVSQNSIDGITQESSGLGETGDLYLVGRDLLYRSNSRLIAESTLLNLSVDSEEIIGCFDTEGDYAGVRSRGSDHLELLDLLPIASQLNISDKVVTRATYIPELDWVLVAEAGVEEAFVPIANLKSKIYLLVVLVLGGVVGFALLVGRTMVLPLERVVEMVKDIAHGEGDLTGRLDIQSADEIGELAKWFDSFISKLQEIISSVKNGAREVAAAAEQIAAAAEEMAVGAEEQQNQLSEVATSVEEMSAMILQTSQNADETMKGSDAAREASEKGLLTVGTTIQGMGDISGVVSSASEQISSLQSRSEEIGDVIVVIDEIADQTNLLALNANIEAARAGEAGRGFAVVADEVRKLAERTVQATANIAEKISLVQASVNEVVEAMSAISAYSTQGQAGAEHSGKALEQIGHSIERVNSAIAQIASAAIEQSSGAEQISVNVEAVSTVSKQSASSAHELSAAADELKNQIRELDELMMHFKV